MKTYLGAKKNAGLKEAIKIDFDYLLEMNSDDVIFDELLELYETYDGIPFFRIIKLHVH